MMAVRLASCAFICQILGLAESLLGAFFVEGAMGTRGVQQLASESFGEVSIECSYLKRALLLVIFLGNGSLPACWPAPDCVERRSRGEPVITRRSPYLRSERTTTRNNNQYVAIHLHTINTLVIPSFQSPFQR